MVQMRDPGAWQTMGAITPMDAIARAVKAYRRAKTDTEKRAELAKIKALVTDIEQHVEAYRWPPGDPALRQRHDPPPVGPPLVDVRERWWPW